MRETLRGVGADRLERFCNRQRRKPMGQVVLDITVSLAGRPLFGELGTRFQLERTRVLDSPFATHIKFRVLK
jgi:hypothetical protein